MGVSFYIVIPLVIIHFERWDIPDKNHPASLEYHHFRKPPYRYHTPSIHHLYMDQSPIESTAARNIRLGPNLPGFITPNVLKAPWPAKLWPFLLERQPSFNHALQILSDFTWELIE